METLCIIKYRTPWKQYTRRQNKWIGWLAEQPWSLNPFPFLYSPIWYFWFAHKQKIIPAADDLNISTWDEWVNLIWSHGIMKCFSNALSGLSLSLSRPSFEIKWTLMIGKERTFSSVLIWKLSDLIFNFQFTF